MGAQEEESATCRLRSRSVRRGGSASTRCSRSRRETSERRASRNLRQATVTSQPFGSAGCRSGQVSAAWMSASCTASSAVAKVNSAMHEDADHRGRQLPQQQFVDHPICQRPFTR